MDVQHNKKIEKLEEENRHLKVGISELSILNEIATAIRSTQTLEKVIDLIINKCIKHLHVEQGAVFLLEKNQEEDNFKTMVRQSDLSSQSLPYRMDAELLGWMIKNKKPLFVNDYRNDTKIGVSPNEMCPIKSILSVPLIARDQLIGLLAMFNKKDAMGFNESDQRLLSIIATQSAQVIENTRLFEEERRLLGMREEMRFAKDIQIGLLPDKAPLFKGYDIAGMSIPAKEVGGDYFDFIPISNTQLAFCLGDVSGKGLPASLLMANLQATLRGQTLLKNSSAKCLFNSNFLLYNSTSSEKYATLFYGILDISTNELTFSNAGHDNPFIFSQKQKILRLQTGGIVLGFMDTFKYEETKYLMKKADVLLIYSDGLTEAMNSSEEEFGEDRLQQLVQSSLTLTSEEIINRVISEINKFAGDTPQMDDMTIIIIKRLAG